MNYQEAMEYIERCAGYGIVPGLDCIRELLNRLGNPEEGLNIIHLAGTNGKGSTLAFLCSALTACGYRVGTYVSPTIFEYRERFQIGGKPISKAHVARLMERAAAAADEMEKEGLPHPTPFEIETAMSFLLFQEKKCDPVILETGMGGELDATNVIKDPLICVITPISMDHTAFLGDSLEEITRHKAGIIKPGAVVVSAAQKERTDEQRLNEQSGDKEVQNEQHIIREIIRQKALEADTKDLIFVEEEAIQKEKNSLRGQSFSYGPYSKAELSLLGTYQTKNAALALEVLLQLQKLGYLLPESKLLKGMKEAVWPGRFQILAKNPIFIADGAHNEAGAIQLRKSLEFYFTNKRFLYIMGMFRDKECDKVISHTHELAEHIITVAAKGNPRALPALELAQKVSVYHPKVTAADSIEEAVELAFLLADKDTVIVAFGSLAYLGDCIHTVLHRNEMRKDTHGK